MKFLFILVFALLRVFSFGQHKHVFYDSIVADSVIYAEGFVPVRHNALFVIGRFCARGIDTVIIDNDLLWQQVKKSCQLTDIIDFEQNMVLIKYFGGDCHVRFKHQTYLDTANKKMVWRVYSIYGGCRAAGGKLFMLVLPRLPQSYRLEVDEVGINK